MNSAALINVECLIFSYNKQVTKTPVLWELKEGKAMGIKNITKTEWKKFSWLSWTNKNICEKSFKMEEE